MNTTSNPHFSKNNLTELQQTVFEIINKIAIMWNLVVSQKSSAYLKFSSLQCFKCDIDKNFAKFRQIFMF